ncbi:helix-turn-helix transcriptional regulator [Agromyces intestinalis]|uniref:Helix-turn-helix transcriptional regulator n=1 Tax=Agromyces intestinalis TaxID=2592652 RepID=A0A5C1YGV5_9MICO|nr:helix-turn-helix domain-containing protein [Agromyces intestinalis]QEO13992.1 helix-turn-helix transcriptional regulator [Agromyces intestinalis]
MLRYLLTEDDLGAVRFGISPLCELGLSLRAILDPSRFPLQVGWLRRTEAARERLDMTVLGALIDERLWTPDFLNPRPESPLTRLEDELAVLAATPREVFRADLVGVHGRVPDVFEGSSRRALARIVTELTRLWETCFEPYWPRMRAVLEADIGYRGRQVAQAGVAAMLNGLSSGIAYEQGVVSVALRDPSERLRAVGGEGLTLVPTMFTRRASAPVGDGLPMVMYSARGQGALWEAEPVANPAAVAAVLGEVRASLLTVLGEPASSTELAVRLDVTPSAVNQHLRVLRAAGLLTSSRSGRSVLYLRSDLGAALLEGATG